MNRIVITGWMSCNPQNNLTQKGFSRTNFRVNVHKRMVDPEGSKYNYFWCVAYKGVADYIYNFCRIGSKVALEGSLETRSYFDQVIGKKRWVCEIIVDRIEILHTTVNEGDRIPQEGPMEVATAYEDEDGEIYEFI